jgi:hypothetical protein
MTRNVFSGLAIACALAVSVAAQTADQKKVADAAMASGAIMFSGCVERDSAGPSGTGVAGNPAGNPNTTQGAFKLVKAEQKSGPKTAEEGKDVRMLAKGKDVDFSKHVGHRVEVTGAFSTTASQGGSGTGGTPVNPRAGVNNPNSSTSTDAMRKLFEVTALKMVSACDAK